MYLKKLELHGFKSFAAVAILEFEHGISAIVGPVLWIGWAAYDAYSAKDLSHRAKSQV